MGRREKIVKKRWMHWCSLCVTLGIMALIFFLSSQNGSISAQLSDDVAQQIYDSGARALAPVWFSQNLNANIRKWAHIYMYCALGASAAVTAYYWLGRRAVWQQGGCSALFCVLYAASDELHQFFVPGRAMLLSDILVDAAGFLPCIAVVCLFFWFRHRRFRD